VNVYVPNSKRELTRLEYRQQWDRDFLAYLKKLEKKKPVVWCGDLNVAHTEIDLANPKANMKNHGFTPEERAGFDAVVKAGFIDTFREFEQGGGHYTWWSQMSGARARNVGWRLDYFLISAVLRPRLRRAFIQPAVMGSDHCRVGIELELVPQSRHREASPRLADADGVLLRLRVHRGPIDILLCVLIEDQRAKRRRVHHEALRVLELAIDLHLDAAVFAIADIGRDLEATVGHRCLLDARAGHGALSALVEEHEARNVFQRVFVGGLRGVGAFVGFATADEQRRAGEEQGGEQEFFHSVCGVVDLSLTKMTTSPV